MGMLVQTSHLWARVFRLQATQSDNDMGKWQTYATRRVKGSARKTRARIEFVLKLNVEREARSAGQLTADCSLQSRWYPGNGKW